MLTKEENETVCRVGPGTPMGDVFRRFWWPVATSDDFPAPDSPPKQLKLLGERFVGFRDTNGAIGMLDELCPHRGASLTLGRVEECGLRCIYHGWKFAVDGSVMDILQHSNPQSLRRMKANAYPVREAGGLIWAYIGPAEKEPLFPSYPLFHVPPENRTVCRTQTNVNYLALLEGGLDSSHVGVLHSNYTRLSDNDLLQSKDTAPKLEVQDTDFGYFYAAMRKMSGDNSEGVQNVRIYPYSMPTTRIIPMWDDVQSIVFEVPIDDEHSCTYACPHSRTHAVDPEREMRGRGFHDPKFWKDGVYQFTADMAESRWGQNREIMGSNWSGFEGIAVEDFACTLSSGPIFDRSKEHLLPADIAIVKMRRILLDSAKRVAAGGDPIGYGHDFAQIIAKDVNIAIEDNWRDQVMPPVTEAAE